MRLLAFALYGLASRHAKQDKKIKLAIWFYFGVTYKYGISVSTFRRCSFRGGRPNNKTPC